MNFPIKRFVSLLAVTLAGVSAAVAADDNTVAVVPDAPPANNNAEHTRGHDGKRMQAALDQRLQQLDQSLQLTADQKQKIKDIWAKQAEGMKDVPAEQRRGKGMEALKASRDQVRAVLTPEQQTKFDAMKPEGERKGKGKKGA